MYDLAQFDGEAAARELRAELARHMIPIYQLAARVELHPSYLGQLLRGRQALSPDQAARIRRGIHDLAQERAGNPLPAEDAGTGD